VPVLERSTISEAVEADAMVNFTVSTYVVPVLATAMTYPRRLSVADVSTRPPRVASLLFSELKSPVSRTAKAMRTIAVSSPVIPRWFCKNVTGLPSSLFLHSFMECSLSAGRLPGRRHRSAIIS